MTTVGKANDPAPARLDGKSLAPEPSEDNVSYRCPIGSHVWDCYGCVANHTRAHQETTPEETDRTWSRCRCMPCITAHLNVLHHRQVDTGDDYSRLIDRHEAMRERAIEHLEHVTRVLDSRARALLHKQNAANAKSKLGPWEFTLTYSPRQHGWSRDEAKDAMRTAIERLTRYYRAEIEEFHATGELNANGDPHVHAWYRMEGGRKITTKSFQRAYPIWNPKTRTGPRGHVGGHHEPIKRQSDFDGYRQKDLDTAWLNIDITNAVSEEAHLPEAEGDDEAAPSGSDAPDSSPEPHDG